jgi:hypothetical protein
VELTSNLFSPLEMKLTEGNCAAAAAAAAAAYWSAALKAGRASCSSYVMLCHARAAAAAV